jgi:hypothetical protein
MIFTVASMLAAIEVNQPLKSTTEVPYASSEYSDV